MTSSYSSTVPLPRINFRSRCHGLEVSLQGALLLNLPAVLLRDNPDGPSTTADLMTVVNERQLWISRVGPCLLRFSVLLPPEEALCVTDKQLKEYILSNEIWGALGLRLVEADGNEIVFSVQHPDLSSCLVPPRGVLTAELKEVRAAIKISGKGYQKHVKPRQEEKGRDFMNPHVFAPHELRSEDLRAIEEFLSHSGIQQTETDDKASQLPSSTGQGYTTTGPSPSEGSLREMIQSATNILLLGGKKRHTAITWIGGREWHGLVQIAPAVFNISYLQIVAQKAKFMPTIAMSLCRMMHAESPSLRSLAASFTDLHMDDKDMHEDPQIIRSDYAVSGIEKSIWKTLLANTQAPGVVTRTKRKRAASNCESEQMTLPPSHTSDTQNILEVMSAEILQVEQWEHGDILQLGEATRGSSGGSSLTPTAATNAVVRRENQDVGSETLFMSDFFLDSLAQKF